MKTLDESMPHLVPAAPNAATSATRTPADHLADIRAKAGAEGLYSAQHEHDACGVGFVVDIKGRKSHQTVTDALYVLENLEHRGAVGADPLMGDGAGILVQIPHRFFAEECPKLGFELPDAGRYGVGQFFLPQDEAERTRAVEIVERSVKGQGLAILGWRDVPVDNSALSDGVRATEPVQRQLFVMLP